MTRNRRKRGGLAAITTCLALLAVAPGALAAPQLDLKIKAPKGADAMLDELNVEAKCTEACTVGLQKLNVLRMDRAGQQQPGAVEQELKATKKLKAGQKAVFRVALAPVTRAHIQGALSAKQTALVQVVPTLNGTEWGYRQASIRTPAGPKVFAQDQIVVPAKARTQGPGSRFKVSIEGVQTTKWHYNRNEARFDGCIVFARGDGTQTIRFHTPKPTTVVYYRALKGGAPKLLSDKHFVWYLDLKMNINRDGKEEAGVDGENCYGGGGGHCPDCEPGGEPPECTKTGTRDVFTSLLVLDRKGHLTATSSVLNSAPGKSVFDQKPDCPIHTFKGALGDIDLMDGKHKFGDPSKQGGGGKVIVIARGKRTDPLDEGGGYTTTTVRWTITFRRIG